METVLSIFLMMEFSETLEVEWSAFGISEVSFPGWNNYYISTWKITSHKPHTFDSRNLFELFYMIHVNVGTFVFETRKDLEHSAWLLFRNFSNFGLEMHIGGGNKNPNTKCVFFPIPILVYLSTLTPTPPSMPLPLTN